jgi:hypothetical protein
MWSVLVSCTRRPTRRPGFPAIAVALIAAGCGDPAARVTLVALGGACGRPAEANLVKVTAFAASGERSQSVGLDEAVAIADFPADTEQLGVEVMVGGGGVGAAGKSAPLAFDALGDGATIPVFMAPPDGFCEVGPLSEPRAQPLVARAGDGVLVIGGVGPSGPLSTAEYYDPAVAAFTPVAVPQVLAQSPEGFTGSALATLPDGRVALIGGPDNAFVVFDPKIRAFATDPVLIDSRAFHAALATGGDGVLVAGGCLGVAAGQCNGLQRRQVLRYHVSQIGDPDRDLPTTGDQRIGAQLFDLGIQLDGQRRFLLAGGTGDPGLADRFAFDDLATTAVPGGHAQPVALDGGAVLAAFAGDAAPADGAAAIYPPEAAAARSVAAAPGLRFVRLIGLEDGRVLGFGVDLEDPLDPVGRVVVYDPTRDAWREIAAPANSPGVLRSPSLVRLSDGAVLVIGGAMSPRAWLFRPSLVGPASGSVTVVPASDRGGAVLTAPDPATVQRTAQPAEWRLTAPDDALTARALVGGPRIATGSVRAVVHVRLGGVALIAQQLGPGQAIVAELVPGAPPRVARLDGGAEHTVCSAPPALAAFDAATPVTLELSISDHDARLSINEAEVLVCSLVASDRGSWGIASLGAGAELTVDSVTVAR